ncbi:MAG: hypothetical protein ACUVX8_05685 [Candidatus Zipacnadales bacterium]
MKTEDKLQEWAAVVQQERIPQPVVAARVITRLRHISRYPANDFRPFAWVAGVGIAIAVPLAFAALLVWQLWNDPLVVAFMEPSWNSL